MSDMVPVSLSLMTGDDVFQTSDGGSLLRWRAAHSDLRELVEVGAIARAGEADAPNLLRDVVFLDVEGCRVVVPVGVDLETATTTREVSIVKDDSDEFPWEDWLGVERQLTAMLQTCHMRRTELVLTCEPPDGYVAKCQIGTTRTGVEAIFVMQNAPSKDGPWVGANNVGDYWVLQSPITSDAVGAAAQLLKMALRARIVPPTSVFPSYVDRPFVGEG